MMRFTESTRYVAAALVLLAFPALAQDSKLSIEREGEALRVNVPSARGKTLVLEARRFINESPDWNPVLRLKSPNETRSFYDPMCRIEPTRFYRLSEANDGGLPWADNFKLLDLDGRSHELFYHSDKTAIILLAAGDSLDNLAPILEELNGIREDYKDEILTWVIHSEPTLDRAALKQQAASLGIDFPVLLDPGHVVTRNLRPTNYPEAFLVRPLDWTHIYQGAVFTELENGQEVIRNDYLRNALAKHVNQENIDVELAEAVGIRADVPELGPISYEEDIVPILRENCVKCHSEGNIGPFALDSYESVLQRSFLIKHQVMSGEMPPWHADSAYGNFENETRLSDREKAILVEWINRGAEKDTEEDPLKIASISDPSEWILGEPDYIVEIPRQQIPADGTVDYRYLVVENPVPGDAWLKAAVVIPGNAEVVHHSLVFMITDPADLFAVQGGLAGFYAGYVPGLDESFFPEGTGKFLPGESAFVFQQHYTPNGERTSDVTKLGLYVADAEPEKKLLTSAAFTISINIPKGHPDYTRTASTRIMEDSWLYEMSPHMHYRGRHFRFEAQYPDGTSEILLSTPDYHFDWQRMYRLEEPKFLPTGTLIRCLGGFDNSPLNPWNPDPNQSVRFGEQSWDEMFIGYFNFAVAN